MKTRILIVDDNESLLSTLSLFLGKNGYAVATASNVDKALGELGANSFDFLLIDLAVGNRNGEEILFFLGLSLRPPPKKVIVMTATPDAAEKSMLRSSIHAVLAKPFPLEDLLRMLQEEERAFS